MDEFRPWYLTPFFSLVKWGEDPLLESTRCAGFVRLDPITRVMVERLREGPLSYRELARTVHEKLPQVNPKWISSRHEALVANSLIHEEAAAAVDPYTLVLQQTAKQPRLEFVEVTNHCGLSCITCPAGLSRMTRKRGFIDESLFARALAEAQKHPGRERLILHNMGEPLLHPDIDSLVAMAADAGLSPELSTNAGLLGVQQYRRLRDAGLAWLIVALDGMDEATLEMVRGKAARADQALSNLDAIIDERRRNGERHPTLVVQMLRLACNQHQHRHFVKRFGDLHALGVVAFLRPLEADTEPRLFAPTEEPIRRFCRTPWQSVGVLWDGRVTTCCMDWNGRNIIGDLKRQSLTEIWHGAELASLRERLRQGRCTADDMCSECAYRPDRYQPPSFDTIIELPSV